MCVTLEILHVRTVITLFVCEVNTFEKLAIEFLLPRIFERITKYIIFVITLQFVIHGAC